MKKLFYLILFYPFFLSSAPVGNPASPAIIEEGFVIPDTKWVSFRLGYQLYENYSSLFLIPFP